MKVNWKAGTSGIITLLGEDPERSQVDFYVVDLPEHGTLSGTTPGLRYTPAKGFTGADTFRYVANDGQLNSEPAMIIVSVSGNGKVTAKVAAKSKVKTGAKIKAKGKTKIKATANSKAAANR